MILSKAQAEGIYSAMVALNNIAGVVNVKIPLGENILRVCEGSQGTITLEVLRGIPRRAIAKERYDSQAAFARAYDLAA